MADYRDDEWPAAPDPEEAPAWKYFLRFIRGRKLERFGNHKIEMKFEVVEPAQWAKKIVKRYFAAPKDGPISQDSTYFDSWCLANGSRPKRGDRMTPQVFHGYWWAKTGHTKKKAT